MKGTNANAYRDTNGIEIVYNIYLYILVHIMRKRVATERKYRSILFALLGSPER